VSSSVTSSRLSVLGWFCSGGTVEKDVVNAALETKLDLLKQFILRVRFNGIKI